MPRSLTNAYWIHVGELRERERIVALLEAHVSDLDLEWFEMKCSDMVALIRGDDWTPDNPYNIKTNVGQRLWTYLNNQHGSGTWGLAGELIPLIEKQVAEAERERILNIISEESCDCSDDCDRIDMFFPHLRDRINNV
jgi:hypothetical protein